MKKFVYLLLSITGIFMIAANCLASGHNNIPENLKNASYHTFTDILVYWMEVPTGHCAQYLTLNQRQHTYEISNDYLATEIGTYKRIEDTLYMTPRLAFDNSGNKWISYELPTTDTTKAIEFLNVTKTFLIKEDGDELIDLTTYTISDSIFGPGSFITHNRHILLNRKPWTEGTIKILDND